MANVLLYYLIVINVLTFFVYGIDKWKAVSQRGQSQIRLSSAGALLGMKVWRHKTQHKKFKYGLPLILLAQIALFNFIS